MAGLKTLFAKAIENHTEKNPAQDGSAKAVTPGSPIIEFVASEQGKKWTQLSDALEKDGLSKSFSGIVINGRVSIEMALSRHFEANFLHFFTGRRALTL
jgi:hypothetical protein